MSTKGSGMEQPKTECLFCGDIWQEHTLKQIDACTAMMNLHISAALARDATLQGKAGVTPAVEICPVCSKTSLEHTEAQLRSCAAKWRKHDRGATGLEIQCDFAEADFKNHEPDPDPVKRAQLRARMLQLLCSCGKAYGDHTQNEIRACAERNREKRGRA